MLRRLCLTYSVSLITAEKISLTRSVLLHVPVRQHRTSKSQSFQSFTSESLISLQHLVQLGQIPQCHNGNYTRSISISYISQDSSFHKHTAAFYGFSFPYISLRSLNISAVHVSPLIPEARYGSVFNSFI